MNQINSELVKQRIKERILYGVSQELNDIQVSGQSLHDMEYNSNITDVVFFSNRKVFGKYIVAVKRLLRKLLSPILNKQNDFNTNTVREVHKIYNVLEDSQRKMIDQITETIYEVYSIKELDQRIQIERSELDSIRLELEEERRSLQEMRDILQNKTNELYSLMDNIKMDYSTHLSRIYENIGEFEFSRGNYEKSYYLYLKALGNSSIDEKLEERTVDVFKLVNRNGNNDHEAI